MGHERIGFLPRSGQWRVLVEQLSGLGSNEETVAHIATTTLHNVRQAYAGMPYDESVIKATRFLVVLSMSATRSGQHAYLREHGFSVDEKLSLLSLMRAAKDAIRTEKDSLEVNKISIDSVLQTLTVYERANRVTQLSLFDDQSHSIWSQVGSGSGFCELSRGFISVFTERYLRYFLERTAASSFDDYRLLSDFTRKLAQDTSSVSHHAFDTSKLMQSVAAAWFNKYAKYTIPSDSEISGFLVHVFSKMREEFRREAEGR